MELFKYNNYNVEVNPKALMLKDFANVWDKYKNKDYALGEFSYIWFVGSYTSAFAGIIDREEREQEVLESLGYNVRSKIKIDKKTEKAIEKLEKIQLTPALSFLKTAYTAMEKVRKHIDSIDVSDTKRAESIVGIITKSPSIIKMLSDLEQQVKEESEESSRIKGGKKKGMFEDADAK